MRASLIAFEAVVAALALGAVAFAQPRGGRSAHSAVPAGPGAASTSALVAPASSDAGSPPVPPPPPDVGDGGVRLSPLNPAPNEFSDAGAMAPFDYDRLLADVASLRARAASVSGTLFHSRLAISLETSGDHGRIARLSVGLDDGTVWTSPAAFRAEDPTPVFEHAVAPGQHAVTIDIERRDDRNDTFWSSQRSRFIVEVPADGRLSLDVKLLDDSSMGGDFPSDKKGTYDLRVRAQARARPLAQGN